MANETVDVVLNFNSFMEMDRSQIEQYFDEIYRVAKPGALFFNINRRQKALPQRDASTFDNNPLLYPYRPDDRILLWEEDDFQQVTRSGYGSLPSLAVKRACIVKPMGRQDAKHLPPLPAEMRRGGC